MVLNGVDRISEFESVFKDKRLGLLTSVSGVDSKLQSTIRLLHQQYRLTALFSPEHGVRGDMHAGALVDTYTDPYTGLPVYSLYRKDSKRFLPEMLRDVDAVVYDIQDIGTRYYTFISTLIYAIEDCAKHDKELIILDRINPLGDKVEGNLLDTDYSSFVGAYSLCMRYGLTAGELACMVNVERGLGCKLTIIPCGGWNRRMLFPATRNIWVMPSMGIPRFETALLYPGMCLFEGTNLSEGRGTTCPFEIIGAPYVDAQLLTDHMNAKHLPGVVFTPVYFTPSFSKHKGIHCGGVHAHVTDYHEIESVWVGIELLFAIQEMFQGDFAFLPPYHKGGRPFIELLAGGKDLTNGTSKEKLRAKMIMDCESFTERKKQYQIYSSEDIAL